MNNKFSILIFFLLLISLSTKGQSASKFVNAGNNSFHLADRNNSFAIQMDDSDYEGVRIAANNLVTDFGKVLNAIAKINSETKTNTKIIIGTLGKSRMIEKLIKSGKISENELKNKWEKFSIQTVKIPVQGIKEALVIAGSDKRGTIYGIYELSEQMGVSPWYYWADVSVQQLEKIDIKRGNYTAGEPAVRYRGIFLNDEEPSLGGWARLTFGGFNHQFYEKVFELVLRLRGNFMWPAMWGSAFYDDDPQNGELADKMGIVMGTSHHEPMNCAQQDWKRYGKGAWNYAKNGEALKYFWAKGIERSKNRETITTLAMRGDGDEPMSQENNITLLQKIVADQRKIIKEYSGKRLEDVPQVWALYKEVQDYYDKGMRVPDDVTLLLCDDNWGNVRKLPAMNAKPRSGGYGMYYHFDYVGGPRNYKWINCNQVQRIWEQMNLTYSHGVNRIWIVNVGDLKPMEYPISFFLDMAWNPQQFNPQNLLAHTEKWCAEQFGDMYAKEAARMINLYSKYNRRITPELLNDTIYSLDNYDEFEQVTNDYTDLATDANKLYEEMPSNKKDAFYQLVLYPVEACANLYEMYFAVAKNKQLAALGYSEANTWAERVKTCFDEDSILTNQYNHEISGGKWNHMMDQIHIGYTNWQQPNRRIIPKVIEPKENNREEKAAENVSKIIPDNRYTSIEAEHFDRKNETGGIHWEVIPDMGKTLSGVTIFPQNVYPKAEDNVYLEYDIKVDTIGDFPIYILVSPTLNFNENKGLRYAISIDAEKEQIVNINKEYDLEQLQKWQANSINETVTTHQFISSGKHTLRFRVLEPGIVLQKILIDTGGLKKSYLGAPEKKSE